MKRYNISFTVTTEAEGYSLYSYDKNTGEGRTWPVRDMNELKERAMAQLLVTMLSGKGEEEPAVYNPNMIFGANVTSYRPTHMAQSATFTVTTTPTVRHQSPINGSWVNVNMMSVGQEVAVPTAALHDYSSAIAVLKRIS